MIVAMSQQLARRYTAKEVQGFSPDGNRYEVVHGELFVSPAPRPRHEIVLARLVWALGDYLRPLGRRETLVFSPADISWNDETLVQPDLFVCVPEEMTDDWSTYRTLLLAAEVVSPSTARADRVVKRRLYQENGVATYWIVDHSAGVVEIWTPDADRPEVATEVLRWRITPDAPELTIDLVALFAGLPG